MTISALTKDALQSRKNQGLQLGPPSFGQEQVEADAVAFMLAMRQRGGTLREIVAELDRAGVRTKKGGSWTATTVKRILDRRLSPLA